MKYKMLFDRIIPPKTDDEMINLVLSGSAEVISDGANSAAKTGAFRRSIVFAAAAAISIGVTAAGAYCGWDFSMLFEGFYSPISSEAQGYVDTGTENQTSAVDLSQMGVNLNKTVNFDYGTVNFTGAVADRNTLMIMYDLVINETALEEYHNKFGNSDILPWAELEISENPSECNFSSGYGTKDDTSGIITYTNAYFFRNGYLNKNSVIEPKFSALTLSAGDNSSLKLTLKEPIRLSLPLDFMTEECVCVSPDIEVAIDNYEYHLDEVAITPLSIQWYAKRGSKIGRLEGETAPLTCKF